MTDTKQDNQKVVCDCPCHESNSDAFQKNCYACKGTGYLTKRRKCE